MPSDTNPASHWRQLAAEAWEVASQLTDPQAQRIMQAIAQGYERLAERAQRLAQTKR